MGKRRGTGRSLTGKKTSGPELAGQRPKRWRFVLENLGRPFADGFVEGISERNPTLGTGQLHQELCKINETNYASRAHCGDGMRSNYDGTTPQPFCQPGAGCSEFRDAGAECAKLFYCDA